MSDSSSKKSMLKLLVVCIVLFTLPDTHAKGKRQCKRPPSSIFKHFNRTLHYVGQGNKVLGPKYPQTKWWHNVHNWAGRTTRKEIVAEGLRALSFFYIRHGIDLRKFISDDELYYGNVSRIINVTPTESYRFRTVIIDWLPGQHYRVLTETIGEKVNFFENPAIVHDLSYEVVPQENGVYGGEYSGNKKTTNHAVVFGQYWIDFKKFCGLSKKRESIYYQSDIPMDPPLYVCSLFSSIWGRGQGEGAIWVDGERSVLQNFVAFPPP